MKRILIMGLPGAGKTTLAKQLADQLNAAWFNGEEKWFLRMELLLHEQSTLKLIKLHKY